MNRHAVFADMVFDGQETHHHCAVMLEGERIAWVGSHKDLDPAVKVKALPPGAWLAPGFIDLQVNGGGDVLFNDEPTPAAIATIAAAHRRFGTTSFLPTLISDTPEKMRAALDAMRRMPGSTGALGLHLEGPHLSPEKPGVHDPAMIRPATWNDTELLNSPGILLVTLAPECVPAGFINALVSKGVRVSLGHSMATYAQTKAAIAEGITGFTHLFNAMRPLASREPGPIAAALESADAWIGLIVDRAHVAAPMLRLALRGAACPMLVTDAMPPLGGREKTFTLHGKEFAVQGSHCEGSDGTLAGTALDMASAVRNCVQWLDVPLATALGYASAEPARFLGVADRIGRLATGYRADMVAIDPIGVRVLETWVAGKSATHE